MILISHGNGEWAWYVHIAYHSAVVSAGQVVQEGQAIAVEGDTGRSIGSGRVAPGCNGSGVGSGRCANHLHFEVRTGSRSGGYANPTFCGIGEVKQGATYTAKSCGGPVAGSLTVHIAPAEVCTAARWRVDGGAWQASGATAGGLAAGGHAVSFSDVDGWDRPGDVGVTIAAGQNTSFSRDYARHVGNLQVTIGPADAPGAGARWRRTGTSAWLASGAIETGLPTGGYTVEFNDLAGPWVKPANAGATIAKNATTSLDARYNRPPVLADPGSHFVHVGAALDFPVAASDPDGDGVALSVVNAPAGGSFSSSGGAGTFHFTASPAQAGQSLSVSFTATEAYRGLTATKSAAIQVGAPPSVAPLGNRTVVASNTVTFTVSASDPENDPKTFEMSGAPAGATLAGSGNSRTFSYTAVQSDAGRTFDITFTATDPDGAGSATMALQVKSPPVFGLADPQRVRAGSLLVRAITASDPDGDAMRFLVSGRPDKAHFTPHSAGGVFAYFPTAAEIGRTYQVQFHGIDVDGVRTLTVPITVVGPHDPLTDFDPFCRGTLDGFGGPLAGATYRGFAAGAQGQPVGRNASGDWRNSGGFLVPESGLAARALGAFLEIVAAATPGGSIAPGGTVPVEPGAARAFAVVPDEYYYVADVEVDGASVGATNAYLFADVRSNRSIRALFEPSRTSQGVPHAWLAAHGLTNRPWDEAAAADHGNGMAAWEAWVAGTDPTNPATAFRVEAVEPADGRARVAVRTMPGRRYTFWTATNLVAPDWRPLDYGLSAAGALTNGPLDAAAEHTDIFVPAESQPLFIRSKVQAP